ncbi:alpha-galactosidase [Vibrio algarum]|uniref:alpha-galactosidase n=1 Tax=Vibrio algarum TaxID=3020714 RepID=A0ABT4YR15_9VIBR|nr:alpha-galactosidase [Vibrio sp. KJ40-1]MDB1123999.1 alpha-galactosidase [Vibrio sp. KJ40-1]
MILVNQDALEFHLQTNDSSYIIKVAETGHLINLHYGNKLKHREHFSTLDHRFNVKLGSTTNYAPEHGNLTLETLKLETACYGKGDYRDPQFQFEYADGSRTSDFIYKSYKLNSKKIKIDGLPSCHSPDNKNGPTSLTIILHEPVKNLELHIHYSIFESANIISRSAEVINTSSDIVNIEKALSACIDFSHSDFELIHLEGKWTKEAQLTRHALNKGNFQIDSKKGVSGANHNPFLCLAMPDCDEFKGECYGFGLVYSGNHQCSVEVSPYDYTRVMLGINSFDFRWVLSPKETFSLPEVVMTFSSGGLNSMSRNFHTLVNRHLVQAQWQGAPRPIQVNNWEATYFDFDAKKLLSIAKKAQELGIEMFVLDDGWFGKRDDETTSLGDYFDNKKLRGGVEKLSKRIKDLGLKFGIWVEPEMVSIDSQLYKKHPDWAIQHSDRSPSLGREQLLLDMSNPEVIDYLYEQLSNLFTRTNTDYVKWDHNRNFSDIYSAFLDKSQQASFSHRYVLGLYLLLEKLTNAFPNILFESCSSGGNRFDLGMLAYMPQTWTSDNTDALERMSIQYGTSLLYPLSTMSAHVSGRPSHQVLRNTSIETRFNVAAFGNLGFQLDITQLTPFESKAVKQQIAFYKQHRSLLQYGEFYRLKSPFENNQMLWMVINDDNSEALLGYYQKQQQSNSNLESIRLPMLNANDYYQVLNRPQYVNIRQFGDLVNEQLPVSIKDRGVLHGLLANHYMHEVTKENYELYGDQISAFGIPLKSQFVGTEMTDEVRFIGDCGSRIYQIRKLEINQ